jgi:hypothetical protein
VCTQARTHTHTHRLSLDKEDILNWGSYTKDEVLLYSCLSAKWENNDAIDKAVTGSLGDKKVRGTHTCTHACTPTHIAVYCMQASEAPANTRRIISGFSLFMVRCM